MCERERERERESAKENKDYAHLYSLHGNGFENCIEMMKIKGPVTMKGRREI